MLTLVGAWLLFFGILSTVIGVWRWAALLRARLRNPGAPYQDIAIDPWELIGGAALFATLLTAIGGIQYTAGGARLVSWALLVLVLAPFVAGLVLMVVQPWKARADA
jgi:hypothetical protein